MSTIDESIVSYLRSIGVTPKKSLGQNFLINRSVIKRIVETCNDIKNVHVIEIGPGPGVLTRALKDACPLSLTLIEYDERFQDVLQSIGAEGIVFSDVLKVDLAKLVKRPCVFVSNLPYNISVNLLYKLMPIFNQIEYCVFMFQKEVADRIKAKPNTKDYGKLSVLMQTYCDIETVMQVSPGSFLPTPAVSSTILKITPLKPQPEVNCDLFNHFLTKLFENRRKKLKNKLKGIITSDDDLIASKYDLRAEDVTVHDYVELFKHMIELESI